MADADVETNPLLEDFEFPPYHMIEPRHIRPAIDYLVKKLESDLEELERTLEPSWPKLVEPSEKIHDRWTVVWGMIDHLETVRDTAEVRAAIEEVQADGLGSISDSTKVNLFTALLKLFNSRLITDPKKEENSHLIGRY